MDGELPDDGGADADAMGTEQGPTEQQQEPNVDIINPDLSAGIVNHSQLYETDSLREGAVVDTAGEKGPQMICWNKAAVTRDGFEIRAPQVREPWEYVVYDDPEISEILQEYDNEGDLSYLVRFTDDRVEEVSFEPFRRFDGLI